MIYNISSKENKNIKLAKQLKRKHHRNEHKRFVAEGKKIVIEAIIYAPQSVDFVVATETFLKNEPDVITQADEACKKVYIVPQNIFDDISDTDSPQGVLAVIKINEEEFSADDVDNLVVLDGVSEPGNLGTVIRSAEAFGFGGIYLMKGSADIYSEKTVRATMGSVFRMKFKNNCSIEDLRELQQKGFSVISTTPKGAVSIETMKSPKKMAVVIGNEAHGVCDEVLDLSDIKAKISMDGRAESLNAAVAAGIVMHWLKNN
jgi:TrmH family RNA methyltransferase